MAAARIGNVTHKINNGLVNVSKATAGSSAALMYLIVGMRAIMQTTRGSPQKCGVVVGSRSE